MAKLVISRNSTMLGSRFIEATRLSIGRASGNDVQLDDPSVSKQHALIDVVGNDHILVDLGSANGTFVNGGRVARHMLRHGDIIEVRDFQIRYVDHKSMVAREGDRTMVVARDQVSLSIASPESPPGLRTSAAPIVASPHTARQTKVDFAHGSIRVIAGGIVGREVQIERPLYPLGKDGQRAAIFRRIDGFYLARVEGQPPKLNGHPIAAGWQRLGNRDFIEINSETMQVWIGKAA